MPNRPLTIKRIATQTGTQLPFQVAGYSTAPDIGDYDHCVDEEFSWLDELQVKVAYGPHPGSVPHVVYLLSLGNPDLGGHAWNDDAFIAELRHLAEAGSNNERYEVPYALSVRKDHNSWGADGASAQIVMYIAEHLVGGALDGVVGWAAVKTLGRLRELVRPLGEDAFVDTPEDLVSFGEWSVRAAYADWLSDDSTLTLIEESRADDEWTGWFQDRGGNEFGVTLRPLDGHPHRVRVVRRAPHQGHGLPPLLEPNGETSIVDADSGRPPKRGIRARLNGRLRLRS